MKRSTLRKRKRYHVSQGFLGFLTQVSGFAAEPGRKNGRDAVPGHCFDRTGLL